MTGVPQQPWFSVGAEVYTGADVLLAARWWDETAGFEQQTRAGLARSLQRQADDESPADDDEAALDAAAAQFRTDRDLLSAQAMQDWLASWNFTAEGWYASLERRLTLAQPPDREPGADALAGITPEEVAECLRYDGVCHGVFARWARRLAERAAVQARLREHPQAPPWSGPDDPRTAAFAAGLPAADRARFDRVVELERDFARCRAVTLTDAALDGQVQASHLQWISLDCSTARFADLQAAREARLCVVEDGAGLVEAAGLAQAAVQRARLFIEDAPASLQAPLLSASPGALLGPVADGPHFVLYLVHDKILPALGDPLVRARAERAVWDAVVARELADRVHWLVRW